jgi:hypothetical protein
MSGKLAEAIAAENAAASEASETMDSWLEGIDEQELSAPETGATETPEEETTSEAEADHGNVEDEADEGGETEGEEEAEGGDEGETGEEDEARGESRGEKRRRKIREELTPEIQAERDAHWQKELQPFVEQHKQALSQVQELDAEAERQQLIIMTSEAQRTVMETFLKENNLYRGELVTRLENARLKAEAEHLKTAKQAAADAKKKREKPEQNGGMTAAQIEDIRLTTMAQVAKVDIVDLKAELLKRHRAKRPYDPQAALDALLKKQTKKPKKDPPVSIDGEGGGSGAGAPPLELDLLNASDDQLAAAAEEMDEDRRRRRKG